MDLENYRSRLMNEGIVFDFGGEYGEKHIQVRDGDRTNLVSLRVDAEYQIENDTNVEVLFRVAENINIPLSPTEVIDMTEAAKNGYYGILSVIWPLADQITNAQSIEELPTIPQ